MTTQRRPTDFQYEDCTIPPGMTVHEWRGRRARNRRRKLWELVRMRLQRSK